MLNYNKHTFVVLSSPILFDHSLIHLTYFGEESQETTSAAHFGHEQ